MLEAATFDIDLARAKKLYRQSRIQSEPQAERASLAALLKLVDQDFLADWSDDWTVLPREQWRQRRLEALLRSSQLAAELDEDEGALTYAERAIHTDEYSEEAWAYHLRAMAALNRAPEAFKYFRLVRERRRVDIGIDFSSELIDLAKRAGSAEVAERAHRRLSQSQVDFMANVMEAHVFSNPVVLLPILASEEFKKEAYQHPLQAWTLLRAVIENTSGGESNRLRVMITALSIAQMVDEYGAAFDYGEWLIENTPEQAEEHRYAMNRFGFISFELRDWEGAESYLRRHNLLCERYGRHRERIGEDQPYRSCLALG